MSSLFSRVSSARLHARVSLVAALRGGHVSCFAERLLALMARCRITYLHSRRLGALNLRPAMCHQRQASRPPSKRRSQYYSSTRWVPPPVHRLRSHIDKVTSIFRLWSDSPGRVFRASHEPLMALRQCRGTLATLAVGTVQAGRCQDHLPPAAQMHSHVRYGPRTQPMRHMRRYQWWRCIECSDGDRAATASRRVTPGVNAAPCA